jgi:hypothetical protein
MSVMKPNEARQKICPQDRDFTRRCIAEQCALWMWRTKYGTPYIYGWCGLAKDADKTKE